MYRLTFTRFLFLHYHNFALSHQNKSKLVIELDIFDNPSKSKIITSHQRKSSEINLGYFIFSKRDQSSEIIENFNPKYYFYLFFSLKN